MDINNSDLLKQVDFAKRFGMHVRGEPYSRFTLIAWIRNGEGPPHAKVGRDTVYSWEAAMDWLDRQLGKQHAA